MRGSWPLWVGAMLLAGLNAPALFVSGGPWGVTSAFALWGSKILAFVGVDVLRGLLAGARQREVAGRRARQTG